MKLSILIGMAVGLATGLWMWTEFWLGLHTTHRAVGQYTGALAVIFPIAGIVIALKLARRRGGACWGLGRALHHGAWLTLAASVVHTLMTMGYVQFINPAWTAGKPGAATALVLQSGVGALLGGVLIATIASIMLRQADSNPSP